MRVYISALHLRADRLLDEFGKGVDILLRGTFDRLAALYGQRQFEADRGKVEVIEVAKEFSEIVAGTVLAGEISLGEVISSLDWVSRHDQYGRNDPTRKPG